jgi:glucose-1-phosphate thymidylyltransferase
MAGLGTRLRPHTWSKPKPLVSAAGKTVLGHVLDILSSAPNAEDAELVFIVGYLGEQVEAFMQENYPKVKTHYIRQKEMLGQSHAVAMAREFIHGPTLIVFVDTIIDADLSFLADEEADAVIWVKEVEDPRRFGVVAVDERGWVQGLLEKPDSMDNKLAIVGIYYFARGEELLAAIDEQLSGRVQTRGEYYLADAMGLMIQKGLKMRPQTVDVWLDAGLPETVLETNRYLLDHGRDNSKEFLQSEGVVIKPPVHVHPGAQISSSTIGPYASIGAGCRITGSSVEDSVIEAGAEITSAHLKSSLVGRNARVDGLTGSFNLGDDSEARTE